MEYKEFKLAKILEMPDDVRIFAFHGTVPQYQPGNFFLIRLAGGNGKKIFRPFSAASHHSERSLRFLVKKRGAFTSLLWNLKEGDIAEISGPYGTFLLDGSDSERVFIGGGTGISPLRGMIMHTLVEGKRASLFQSAHTLHGMAYAEEMRLLEAKNPRFRFFPAVTRQEMPGEWKGIRGRLSAEVIGKRLGSLDGKAFYICGSKEMASSIAQGLQAAGVPKEKIKKEEWG